VTRTRSEYRLFGVHPPVAATTTEAGAEVGVRLARDEDRDAIAVLVLDAYRGTVDDEGEGPAEARLAADEFLHLRVPGWSVVIEDNGLLVAMSFVVEVADHAYVDPVATASTRKRQGLGRRAVTASLRRLLAAGVDEVGAVITDGNTASEALFVSLGFVRVGPWDA
jgi:ribosomal protein S18 acetylase RimI-like enzyme